MADDNGAGAGTGAATGAGNAGGEEGVIDAGGVKAVPIERFNRIYGRSKELEGSLAERDKAIQALSTELEQHRAVVAEINQRRTAETQDEPVTRADIERASSQTKREIRAEQAQAFLLAQPEAKADEKYKDNIKSIIKEYGLTSLDPINAAEVALNMYRAATGKGKSGEDDENDDGGRAVDKRAVGSLRGGKGGNGQQFTAADIGKMSVEEYKKHREKILSAAKNGEIA